MSAAPPGPALARRRFAAGGLSIAALLAALLAGRTRPGPRVVREALAAPPPSSAPAPPAPARPSDAGMVRVGPGSFRMGSRSKRAEPNESPLYPVVIDAYLLDVTEVRVGDYRACVERGACRAPRASSRACTYAKGDPSLPINCVGFEEADLYCAAAGKRLPTEAEWEFAARGTSERVYPWGDDTADCSRAVAKRGETTTDGCGNDGPLPVGARPAGRSASGVDDLGGNVEEWVSDFYDDRYPTAVDAALNPRGPLTGSAHVLRGGSWLSPRGATRTTARNWGSAMERGTTVGFRCARDDR